MKKTSTLFVFALLLLTMSVINFGQKGADSALLYKVSGKGLKKPSYILGTFHAICPTDMLPVEKLTNFVNQTDQMYLELDMDDPAVTQSMVRGLAMPNGKTLKDLFKEDQYAKVEALLKNSVGIPIEAVKGIKPSMLSVMIATSPRSLGCTPAAVDTLVMKAATDAKKPVFGLETVESQIAVLNSQPLEKQASDLLKLAENPAQQINELKGMMAIYKAQDAEKLYQTTTRQMASEGDFASRLLDDRNIDWIPKMRKAMSEKPTFFAVGAGHLGGKKGVVKLLRSKGYKLTPIRL
jgi:uncharacterized protein YbaP (TraB family)